jgi:hypothetical protein
MNLDTHQITQRPSDKGFPGETDIALVEDDDTADSRRLLRRASIQSIIQVCIRPKAAELTQYNSTLYTVLMIVHCYLLKINLPLASWQQ